MGLFARRRRFATELEAAPAPGDDRIGVAIARAIDERLAGGMFATPTTVTREQALTLSVVNRARDLFCGVASLLPLHRYTTWGMPAGSEPRDLGPGWLERPDPTRTRGAWTSAVVDDLFFYGWAVCRVTSRDSDSRPNALVHVPWSRVAAAPAGHPSAGAFRQTAEPQEDVWTFTDTAGRPYRVLSVNVIPFESPLTAVLAGPVALWIAGRLDQAAGRFAGTTVPIGWLKQTGGDPMSGAELADLATEFAVARELNTIAAVNASVDYNESQLDPGRLQLVEARSYSDAALARVCNVPGFAVGATTPGDSMTYKTALSARFDLLDFGLAPIIGCIEDTLSGPDVTPAQTVVRVEVERFLRTRELAAGAAEPSSAATPAATSPGGS